MTGQEKASRSDWQQQNNLETTDSAGTYCYFIRSTCGDCIYVGRGANLAKLWKETVS